jgi:glucose-6-phosphate isomerase
VESACLEDLIDPVAANALTASAAVGIELDYSKNRITDETLGLLFQLAKWTAGTHRRHVFRQQVNITENRAFTPRCAPGRRFGHPRRKCRAGKSRRARRMANFVTSTGGAWKGHTEDIRNVVNIGSRAPISVVMAYEAPGMPGATRRSAVSNVDGN